MSRPTALTVTVAQPCSESWAQMTPTVRGRYCAACTQEVVDFTGKTDAELLAWLAQPATGRSCGRFRPDQLDRPLLPPPAPTSRWRGWLAALLALWAWRGAAPTESVAQHPPTQHLQPRPVMLQSPVGTLRGRVFDPHTRLPLAGVTVQLDATAVLAVTDSAGHFALTPPSQQVPAGRPWTLSFRLPGYGLLQLSAPESTAQPVFLPHILPREPLAGILGGASVQGLRIVEPEPPRRGLLLNLEDWLR